MVGKNQLTIAGTQFAAGLCTSDYLGDGGLGTESQNLNPIEQQGVIYPTVTTTSTNSFGGHGLITASTAYDSTADARAWIADSNGVMYFTDATDGLNSVAGGLAGDPIYGNDDSAIFFYSSAPGLFVTHGTDLDVVHGLVGAVTFKDNYFNSASGHSFITDGPHPLLSYNNLLFIGDGNTMHSIDASGTAGYQVITFDPNEQIMCTAIDPATGLMMIGVRYPSRGLSSSTAPMPYLGAIYLYDGYSAKARRKIPVRGVVYSFTAYQGQILVGMDNTINLWNGNGLTFMRRLNGGTQPVKARVAVIQNIFFVADGTQVLAYGDIQNGKKTWFPIYTNTATSDNIDVLFQENQNSLGVVYGTSKYQKIDLSGASGSIGTSMLYTNNINFERPVFIRRMRVFTTGITTTAGIGGVALIDENGTTNAPAQPKFAVASGTRHVFDFDFGGLKLQTMQPKITLDTQVFGIIRVVLYYDVAE